jgi:hypothetical protein
MAEKFAEAFQQLETGMIELAGSARMPDFADHNFALLSGIESIRTALVRAQLDGSIVAQLEDPQHPGAQIWPPIDRDALGTGSVPIVAGALLVWLEAVTAQLGTITIPPEDANVWADWKSRLQTYRATVTEFSGAPRESSDAVWREVTLPILMGWFWQPMPGVVFVAGAEPPVQKPPDIVTLFGLWWRARWYAANVTAVDQILAGWDTALTGGRKKLESAMGQIGAVIGRGAKIAIGVIVAIGLAWAFWQSSKKPSRSIAA